VKVFEHWILVKADSKEEAKTHIKSFLDKYELLYYDKIEFLETLRGDNIKFFDTLSSLINSNKEVIRSFINDLEEESYKTFITYPYSSFRWFYGN
jgi:chromosomal replication initiation ATPase DnaA